MVAVRASLFGVALAALLVGLSLAFLSPVIGALGAFVVGVLVLVLVTVFFLRGGAFIIGWVLGALLTTGAYFLIQLIRGVFH